MCMHMHAWEGDRIQLVGGRRSKCEVRDMPRSSDRPDGWGKARRSIDVPVTRSKQAGRRECADELALAVLVGLIKE